MTFLYYTTLYMKEPQIVVTEDGSPTLYNEELGEHYHSTHGALTESSFIFIREGLEYYLKLLGPGCFFCSPAPVNIFEAGFGTGLNALLTLQKAEEIHQRIHYYSIEKYPISKEQAVRLKYEFPEGDRFLYLELFKSLHEAPWNEPIAITPYFTLHKIEGDLTRAHIPEDIDLFYMDAFSPEVQNEMWTQELFDKFAAVARPGAVLTTYCAKGEVRRRLEKSGFKVERIPGPPGKRHITRATYISAGKNE